MKTCNNCYSEYEKGKCPFCNAHSDLVNTLLKALSFDGVRCWKRATGGVATEDGFIRYGIVGACDIHGIMKCKISGLGVALEIECKTGQGKLSNVQKNWKAMVNSLGALHIKAQDRQDVDRVVKTVKDFMEQH